MPETCYHLPMPCEEAESLAILAVLVMFAGICSGLTLGLLSLDMTHLKILINSGTEKEKKYAKKILPVVAKHHYLLVTLLFCNAIAAEAMPLFLDDLVRYDVMQSSSYCSSRWLAIFISVGLILFVGEIIPQSLCSRFGVCDVLRNDIDIMLIKCHIMLLISFIARYRCTHCLVGETIDVLDLPCVLPNC